jgi:hypothetical protein
LEQHSTQADLSQERDAGSIEQLLKVLWEKARRASELITSLREERTRLQVKAEGLEKELTVVRQENSKKDDLIRKLKEEMASVQAGRNALLSNGEREGLRARVKDLLERIDSYL